MRRTRPFGAYQIMDLIASGGMAEVHRAQRSEDDDRIVALKVVLPHFNADDEFLEMMHDEARIATQLHHPNIAEMYEFGEVEGQHYLAMEYVEGVDLRALITRCRALGVTIPAHHVLQIGVAMLHGLHAAHTTRDEEGNPLRIVHRDVSPSNVLLGYSGDVKIIDFGIAKAELSRAHTKIGVIKGKIRYMSPEQTRGRRLDARSDVFAAGVVIYEALTLHPPFQGESENELMAAVRKENPYHPSGLVGGIPAGVDAAVLRALAKKPKARFQTSWAFAEALQEQLDRHWPNATSDALGRYVAGLCQEEKAEGERSLRRFEGGAELSTGTDTEVLAIVERKASGGLLGEAWNRVAQLFEGEPPRGGLEGSGGGDDVEDTDRQQDMGPATSPQPTADPRTSDAQHPDFVSDTDPHYRSQAAGAHGGPNHLEPTDDEDAESTAVTAPSPDDLQVEVQRSPGDQPGDQDP